LLINIQKGYLQWSQLTDLSSFAWSLFRKAPAESTVYKETNRIELKVHIIHPEGWKRGEAPPAIVFFCRRGRELEQLQFWQHAKYLASRGMVAILAEFRPQMGISGSFYGAVADAKSAVRWVRSNAAELGVDPNRIVASGGSGRGYLAACTGIIEGFEEEGEDVTVSSVPNSMVLFNPALTREKRGPEYRAISPLRHTRPSLPPVLIFHGTEDENIPFTQVEEFIREMKAHGNRCELVAFEGKGHGFFNYGRGDGKAFYETLQIADRFLTSLGYLEGEPTIDEEG